VPASSASELVLEPAVVKPAAWVPNPPKERAVKSQHTFRLDVPSGYCAGGSPPLLDDINVVDRRRTAERPFKSAVVTVFLLYPAHYEYVGPRAPGELKHGCAGLAYDLFARIKFKRPVGDLTLYDGSYSPPHRVWPPLNQGLPSNRK